MAWISSWHTTEAISIPLSFERYHCCSYRFWYITIGRFVSYIAMKWGQFQVKNTILLADFCVLLALLKQQTKTNLLMKLESTNKPAAISMTIHYSLSLTYITSDKMTSIQYSNCSYNTYCNITSLFTWGQFGKHKVLDHSCLQIPLSHRIKLAIHQKYSIFSS